MKTKLFITLQYILPQPALSRLTGKIAESKIKPLKNFLIKIFIKKYQVKLSEAKLKKAEEFSSFNDFFTRELEENSRVIDGGANSFISPCDGAISEFGNIEQYNVLQAKGQFYTLQKLLANDTDLISKFVSGKFITCYLSPKDYHRVHAPVSGKLLKTTYVPGDLFSVNNETAKSVPNLFARNERLICEFNTEIGSVVVILVGALIVAGIETVWSGHIAPSSKGVTTTDYRSDSITLNKGDELGRFKLGSTAILLFEKDKIDFDPQLSIGAELVLGNKLGTTI